MNMGKASDPSVAIGLLPKNLVMLEGSFDKASRCMAFRNFLGDWDWETGTGRYGIGTLK